MTAPMHLLLVEPEPSGHRMVLHVRLIAQEAIARGWRVDVMTSQAAAGHHALRAVEAVLSKDSVIHFLAEGARATGAGRWSMLRQQWNRYRMLANGIAGLTGKDVPTIAYMVNLDDMYQALAVTRDPFGGVAFAGMMMGVGYHRRAMGLGDGRRSDRLAEHLFRRVLRLHTLRAVTVIDKALHEFTRQSGAAEYAKLAYVPDVGMLDCSASRVDARRELGVRDDQFVILVYGSLSSRKGIAQLLAAVANSDDRRPVVLFAGSADRDATEMLDGVSARVLAGRGQLRRSEGFHDAAREALVFAAADAVWIGYVGFYGSSGVLYQAGAAGLPVIAARDGLIGWLTSTHALGTCCDPASERSVNDAIGTLVRDPALAAGYGARGRKLAALHTPGHFAVAVCDAIEEGVG